MGETLLLALAAALAWGVTSYPSAPAARAGPEVFTWRTCCAKDSRSSRAPKGTRGCVAGQSPCTDGLVKVGKFVQLAVLRQ
jgi:hypothetical protein